MDKRFQYGSATATLSQVDDYLYLLHSVFSRERGKGHATALMQDIALFADDAEATIFLTVQQFGNPRDALNNKELVKFYSKFGFVRDERFRQPVRMIRYYKEAHHA